MSKETVVTFTETHTYTFTLDDANQEGGVNVDELRNKLESSGIPAAYEWDLIPETMDVSRVTYWSY